MEQNLYDTVQELASRLAQLEGQQQKPEVTLRSRLDSERKERIEASNRKEEGNRIRNGSVPTNPERKEEVRRSYMELRGHDAPAKNAIKSSEPSESASGDIEFYCWKEGVLGTIKLSGGEFTPI